MPRKAKATTEGDAQASPSTGLKDNEMRFMKAVFDNMTQRPDANWDNVAADLGLKDAKCAKERFRQITHRHGWRDQPGGNGSPRKGGATGPSGEGKVGKRAPRTPTKKAKAAAAVAENRDDESVKAEDVKGEETETDVEGEAMM